MEIGQARALCDILMLLGDESSGDYGNPKKGAILRRVDASMKVDSVEMSKLLEVFETLLRGHEGNGLDGLSRFNDPTGFYALPRKLEIAGAINRVRGGRMEI